MRNKNLKHKNNFLQARRRCGLEPKQVAFLLSKKSADELYRYENGVYFPNLRTALKLEAIYQTPVRLLFQDLFEELKADVDEKRKSHPHLFLERAWCPKHAEQLEQEEFCFYSELLKSRVPSSPEIELINRHTIALINAVSNVKQGRNAL